MHTTRLTKIKLRNDVQSKGPPRCNGTLFPCSLGLESIKRTEEVTLIPKLRKRTENEEIIAGRKMKKGSNGKQSSRLGLNWWCGKELNSYTSNTQTPKYMSLLRWKVRSEEVKVQMERDGLWEHCSRELNMMQGLVIKYSMPQAHLE